MFTIFKHIHMLVAVLSITGFLIRGVLSFIKPEILNKKIVKILPHINDTILLIAGVSLAIMMSQYPFVAGWVTAKVIALLIYIGLGVVVIKQIGSVQLRIGAFIAALLTFCYIAMVAVSKQVMPF